MTTENTSAASSPVNGSALRDEFKHDAERLKGTLGERAKTEATTRIEQVSQAMGSASTALEAAAEKLESNSDAPKWMASTIQQAARKMDVLAGQLEGRDLDDIGQEATRFARHNPGTFLAVSAAAGFAVARVLRAGVDKKRHEKPGNAGSDKAGADRQDATPQPAIEGIAP